jgi:hypothetical protein
LIGASISLPVLALDAVEGGGALALLGSLTLLGVGVAMHLRAARQFNERGAVNDPAADRIAGSMPYTPRGRRPVPLERWRA